ncbi:MAG TPA: hypothetical protein VHK47_04465 [Polyangia bacterium]|jgi:Rho-binding antiterminator|nr:hypothetical protein [Polyangia bacterium]
MSHQIERCDFIDMLEEAAKMHRPVAVTLVGQTRFADDVRDVVTEDGEDYAEFRDHGRVALTDILECAWTGPAEGAGNYDRKL